MMIQPTGEVTRSRELLIVPVKRIWVLVFFSAWYRRPLELEVVGTGVAPSAHLPNNVSLNVAYIDRTEMHLSVRQLALRGTESTGQVREVLSSDEGQLRWMLNDAKGASVILRLISGTYLGT